ncbi:MAG: hypothetical protein KJ915_04495 [Candidatus Omnitrophica bacterium]|nr:hypothetical protein [Candidatus Omnitrophota bacterium]
MSIDTTDQREIRLKLFSNLNRIVYQDVDFTQLVAQSVKDLAEAYERQDTLAFSDLISRNYLGNKTMLEDGARFDFEIFSAISLKIYINRIEQRGAMYIAETKWDKAQNSRTTGQEQQTKGQTTFTFVLEQGKMKIKNLRGDLIYASLSPHIAEASGKSAAVVERIRAAQLERNPLGTLEGSGDDSGNPAVNLLPIYNSQLPSDAPNFDFLSGSIVSGGNGDIFFETNIIIINGFNSGIKISGQSFAATTDASGLTAMDQTVGDPLNPGDVFIFRTAAGYYGKMQIMTINRVASLPIMTFKYAIQTDLTSNVSTN